MNKKTKAAYEAAKKLAHPLDICDCGDYRKEHESDSEIDGPCRLNGLGHNIPDKNLNQCLIFSLSVRYAPSQVGSLTGDDMDALRATSSRTPRSDTTCAGRRLRERQRIS